MLYSEVLSEFYQIKLSPEDSNLANIFFSASAHHFHCLREATGDEHSFHLQLHLAHLVQMKKIVFLRGDFDSAIDPSFRSLDKRDQWNPGWASLPDPHMMDSMCRDQSCDIGRNYPSDFYLGAREQDCPRLFRFAN